MFDIRVPCRDVVMFLELACLVLCIMLLFEVAKMNSKKRPLEVDVDVGPWKRVKVKGHFSSNPFPAEFAASVVDKSLLTGPMPRVPRESTVYLGSDCSGYGSDYLSLKACLGPEIKIKCVFVADKCPHKMTLLKKLHSNFEDPANIRRFYDDICKRDVNDCPQVDIFVSGAPCPPWSAAGKGKGLDDPQNRGVVLFHSLEYVLVKKPRVVVLENVKGMTFQKHKHVLDDVKEILYNSGYAVFHRVLDTKEHGLPQSRPRLYIIGLWAKEIKHKFSFPDPVPMVPLARFIVPRHDAPAALSAGARKNVKKFTKKFAKKNIDLADAWGVVDASAGPSFASAMLGCSPCLTKSRGGSGGHYLAKLGRYMNIYEIGGLQGIPKAWVDDMLEACPDDEGVVGRAFGDAMSMNVLMRVLPRALWAVGLIESLPPDVWATASTSVGQMPDCIYARNRPHAVRAIWS